MNKLLLALLLLLHSASSFGAGLYGAEWTFTSKRLLRAIEKEIKDDTWYSELFGGHQSGFRNLRIYRDKFVNTVLKKCPECRRDRSEKNKIYFSNDFWILVDIDASVIEINTQPHSVEKFSEYSDLVERTVFGAAKKLGLSAHPQIGGGHIHMDYRTHFQGDLLLLRNFVVDMMNHPEIFMGLLGQNYFYAPPLAVMGPEAIERFKNFLADFDSGKITDFAKFDHFMNLVYKNSSDFRLETGAIGNANIGKHQLLNFEHSETLEIRGFSAQTSAAEYELLLRLLEARLDYLRQFDEPIEYIEKDYSTDIQLIHLRPAVFESSTVLPLQVRLPVFIDYVKTAGLDFDDYKKFALDLRAEPETTTALDLLKKCARFLAPKAS